MGFGDIVVPKPEQISFPVLLADSPVPEIMAYSVESVIAEKFEAMVKLSILNSRMKDFYDIHRLSCRRSFDGRVLQEAIVETFQRRGTPLEREPAVFGEEFGRDDTKQRQWQAFTSRMGLGESSPTLGEVMADLKDFLQPAWEAICREVEFFGVWVPETKEWTGYVDRE